MLKFQNPKKDPVRQLREKLGWYGIGTNFC